MGTGTLQGPACAFFLRNEGPAGTRRGRDCGIPWEKRDPRDPQRPNMVTPAITQTGCVGEKESQRHAIAVFFGKSEIRRDLQGRNLRRFSLLLDLTALLRRPFAPTEALSADTPWQLVPRIYLQNAIRSLQRLCESRFSKEYRDRGSLRVLLSKKNALVPHPVRS